jgi:hypothetical protein
MAAAQQAGLPLNQGVVEDVSNPATSYTFAQPWFYLFQQLWRKLGGQYSTPQTMVFGLQTGFVPDPVVVTFYSVNTGEALGTITLT